MVGTTANPALTRPTDRGELLTLSQSPRAWFSAQTARAYIGFPDSGKIAVVDTTTNKVIGTLDGDADRLGLSLKRIGWRADPAIPL